MTVTVGPTIHMQHPALPLPPTSSFTYLPYPAPLHLLAGTVSAGFFHHPLAHSPFTVALQEYQPTTLVRQLLTLQLLAG